MAEDSSGGAASIENQLREAAQEPAAETPGVVESIESSKAADAPASQVTLVQWRAMSDVLISLYNYREPDGHDPSRLFHRSVNKRNVPDYYDVIKEPMALSVLKQKIKSKVYTHFAEFVRDCALIPHNAQTYNRPKSMAYEDALIIKDVMISEFQRLAEQEIISPETAQLPDLGEIPEADPLPAEEEEEEEEEDEEDEEAEDSDDEAPRRKRKGRPRLNSKRESGANDLHKGADADGRKRRGRPPRVDTPMEARIKAVLKGIRKLKDSSGQMKVRHFERLPDKSAYPDYYVEIKEPLAIDLIKRKSKRKKYTSVDHFMRDVDVMFNNAKVYNLPESQIYRDAVDLHREAHRLAEQEKNKADSEYLMEDGRLPLPNGITYKDEVWRVGDWVHLQNPNDATKPIVAQLYRTWQDPEGEKWINACWYYRPEQTVHHFEKHFYPNEVVKTGQYRDHRIDEVVDRCFVMFFTRYNRGRPRDLPLNKEVYVCEARYNEEKHKLNKIKTWASCLPDEVREKDYEMELFDAPRKIKKIPSPIRHLLKEDAKETDDLPKPTWGAENAPPIVGAVHCRPRDENESPPPEPTPSPPPPQLQPPAALPISRPPSMVQPHTPMQPMPGQDHVRHNSIPHIPGRLPHAGHLAASPQPPMMPGGPHPYHPTRPNMPMYPVAHNNRNMPVHPQTPQPPYHAPQPAQPYSAPHNFLSYQGSRLPQASIPPPVYNPNAPRSVETFHLRDGLDQSIPKEIRDQFQQDDQGRVLFFNVPPLDVVSNSHQGLSHSLKYLAAKERRLKLIAATRKRIAASSEESQTKKQKIEAEAAAQKKRLEDKENLHAETLKMITQTITRSNSEFYMYHYGDRAAEVMEQDLQAHLDKCYPKSPKPKEPELVLRPSAPKLRWNFKGPE
ncbi:Component of the RSC chromatin remodeling complex (Eurofung) [Trichophyton interdigitale]|uniref:Component of the RSC chromatin remodeling complex (Eurofung) n=1 Tax=Trichophyton interdigitale TaxID=101480 RepID=A0A9P4YIF6_9EURO|nr:Component of the RSC chromatin remodeling complex (Eurofung) [Trichophyton interdigitale]KAF3896372.1 Component of the RSC chromatin remodeling complex (Eurofung) [Trichophyton interdigitale]KAG8207696.1 Component of the RSC chromatin remodeling complex (Eurofung) [Trichophyton interdigitale]